MVFIVLNDANTKPFQLGAWPSYHPLNWLLVSSRATLSSLKSVATRMGNEILILISEYQIAYRPMHGFSVVTLLESRRVKIKRKIFL